ncbi:MAG: GntR family transcriptional regulator [Ilumatobacter sp.]
MARGDLPKYLSIANALRTRIDDGELRPGDRLPSQQTMAAEHRVTVMTLRQALAELERDGLVHAAKGRGTFVAEPPAVRFGLDHLWSFAEEMASQGVLVTTEVIGIDESPHGPAAHTARAALAVDGVVEVTRRRSIDGTAVVLQRSFVDAAAWAGVDPSSLRDGSMYATLQRDAGRELERASEVFRATTLSDADAPLLDAAAGTAIMESSRTSFDAADQAFLFDRALMLGSATEIRAERTADTMRLGYATPD